MNRNILIAGDLLAIALITLTGFATHGELGISFAPRMAALYFPLALAWFLLAPWFGQYRPEVVSDVRQIWRPALVMIFATPAALVVRGQLLNVPVLPLFALILGGTCALGMMVWRGLAVLISRRGK
jgi:hypothetical protein